MYRYWEIDCTVNNSRGAWAEVGFWIDRGGKLLSETRLFVGREASIGNTVVRREGQSVLQGTRKAVGSRKDVREISDPGDPLYRPTVRMFIFGSVDRGFVSGKCVPHT